MKIGSIVIHCFEFDKMVEFWGKTLNYCPREPKTDDRAILTDFEKTGSCHTRQTCYLPLESFAK